MDYFSIIIFFFLLFILVFFSLSYFYLLLLFPCFNTKENQEKNRQKNTMLRRGPLNHRLSTTTLNLSSALFIQSRFMKFSSPPPPPQHPQAVATSSSSSQVLPGMTKPDKLSDDYGASSPLSKNDRGNIEQLDFEKKSEDKHGTRKLSDSNEAKLAAGGAISNNNSNYNAQNQQHNDADSLPPTFLHIQLTAFLKGEPVQLKESSTAKVIPKKEFPKNWSECLQAVFSCISGSTVKASDDVAAQNIAGFIINKYKTKRSDESTHHVIASSVDVWEMQCKYDSAVIPLIMTVLTVLFENTKTIIQPLFDNNFKGKTVLDVATQHFEEAGRSRKNQLVHFFYMRRSILVMSQYLATKTADRFVAPGIRDTPADVVKVTSISGASSVTHSRVTIVGGWSGAGKTTWATLPRSSAASDRPICVVMSPRDLWGGDDAKQYGELAALQNQGNTLRRDAIVATLFVKAVLRAFDGDAAGLVSSGVKTDSGAEGAIEVEKEEIDDETGKKHKIRVPDWKKLVSEPAVERIRQRLKLSVTLTGRYELRFVVDEVGAHPILIRSLCNIWRHTLLPLMTKIFNVDNRENIFLYVVGTGTESFHFHAQDAFPSDYSIFQVQSASLFERLLHESASRNTFAYPTTMQFLKEGEFCNESSNKFLEELHRILYIEDNTDSASPPQQQPLVRPVIHIVRRFVQLVSDNARCAALALRHIHNFAATNLPANDLASCMDNLTSLLQVWTMSVCNEFIGLNALADSKDPFQDIGKALRVVMSRQVQLTGQEHFELVVRYGLLFDSATRKVSTGEISWDNDRPRYRMPESVAAIFLFRGNFNVGLLHRSGDAIFKMFVFQHHALCIVLQLGDAIEQNATKMREIQNRANLNNFNKLLSYNKTVDFSRIMSSVPTSIEMFLDVQVQSPIRRIVLSVQLTDYTNQEHSQVAESDVDDANVFLSSELKSFLKLKNEFEAPWTQLVARNKGAVVIRNGPTAPFADVIVLTPGILYLTQCRKVYRPSTDAESNSASSEFEKMVTHPRNARTRAMLMRCCGHSKNSPVKIIASTFVFSDCSSPEQKLPDDEINLSVNTTWGIGKFSVHEQFTYDKFYIAAFSKNTAANNNNNNQAGIQLAALQNILTNLGGPGTTSTTNNANATNASPSPANNAQSLAALMNQMSQNQQRGHNVPRVTLQDVIRSQPAQDALRADPAFYMSRLFDSLPPDTDPAGDVVENVMNPQFASSASALSSALADPDGYREIMHAFGLQAPAGVPPSPWGLLQAVLNEKPQEKNKTGEDAAPASTEGTNNNSNNDKKGGGGSGGDNTDAASV
jgi:hypothetical protein